MDHMELLLNLLCDNPDNKTFELLDQVMKDVYLFRKRNLIKPILYARVLKLSAQLGNFKIVSDIIRQMTTLGYYIERPHVTEVVKQCVDAESAYRILDAIIVSHFEADCEWYHTLIQAYCENEDIVSALEVLRLYNLSGQRPRIKFYSTIIHKLAKKGEMELAETLVNEMTEYFGPPNDSMFNSLIVGYSKKNDTDMVFKTYQKMLNMGIEPTKDIYTTLIFFHLRRKDIHEASILYKQMTEKGIEHDSYLFAALIYLRGILDDSEGARKTYDKMKAAGVIPNTVSFNQLIYSHARDKKISAPQIEALYLEMLAEKLEPNHYTFELLIDAMSKRHAFAKICEVFNEMSQKNIPITDVAYNSPIRHHGLAGNMELAWKFFNRMISAGIEPSMYIYTSIISLATASSDFAIAIKAFKDLLARGLTPNVHVYSALITALVKSGNTKKAIEMLNHMVNHGVSPNHITFTSLIQGFANKRNYEKGKEMYELMKKSNIIPDRFTFYHLEKLYKTTGHVEEIKELHEDMKKYGMDPRSRERILIKGKGSFYWRSRILIKRRIERQKANINPEEQYAIKKRQRKLWKRRNRIREAALQRLYSKLQSSQSLEPYSIWKKNYIQENYEDLQRYKKAETFPF
ncbi:hypothetical protein C2G38_2045418 [Gigaspora rosea]|uniref:Uncharacterized protein n=1 Tax=Gigaspora rosea TaxID=44941 RepID=A0A397UG00_9GLOM|nr:hypothetical protein C2G38_2045418 [Gigaspora rosea]